jgi:hypothetical protein
MVVSLPGLVVAIPAPSGRRVLFYELFDSGGDIFALFIHCTFSVCRVWHLHPNLDSAFPGAILQVRLSPLCAIRVDHCEDAEPFVVDPAALVFLAFSCQEHTLTVGTTVLKDTFVPITGWLVEVSLAVRLLLHVQLSHVEHPGWSESNDCRGGGGGEVVSMHATEWVVWFCGKHASKAVGRGKKPSSSGSIQNNVVD